MSISNFCISQRQKEQQKVKKLLIFGFAGSAFIHGLLAYTIPYLSYLSVESPQVEKPMELIIVDQPKPKPKPKPQTKKTQIVPKPKPEAKPGSSQPKAIEPKAESPQPKALAPAPKPELKPEPPQPKAIEPKPQPPEPKPEPPQPKAPAPKKILTSNLPPVNNTPTVSQPQQAIAPDSNTSAPAKDSSSQVATNSSNVGGTGDESVTGTDDGGGISCVSNCQPQYPAALEGLEGSAGVKLTIDIDGNVIGAELADADSNSQINREALLAARQMQFSSPPGGDAASVQIKIDFTVEGSEYDRLAREEQKRKEQAAQEREEQQEAARQQQLEQERQAQQEQLERERQVRQQPAPQQPVTDTQPVPKPLPALSQSEEQERLRKFRERMENYQ